MGAAMAAAITYDGSSPALQTAPDPTNTANSLFPGATANPIASGNTVIVDFSAGADPARVFGGISNTEDSTGNTVEMRQGTVTARIYGGYGGTVGDAVNNKVTMSGGSVADRVVGGHSINGNAEGNSLVMTGGTAGGMFGGTTGANGSASGNSVVISGGRVGDGTGTTSNGWVLGGFADSGISANNTVTISGSAVVNNIDAGESNSGQVTGNKLFITGGQIMGTSARAGWSDTGLVSGNEVCMSGGVIHNVGFINGHLTGGFSVSGNVENNTVIMTGGSVESVEAGDAIAGDATGNGVAISGDARVTSVWGATAGGDAAGNSVRISGAAQVGDVGGGLSTNGGNAIGNTVIIDGGRVDTTNNIHGGLSTGGAATGNHVIIGGGMVNANRIYGGLADGPGPATGNSVTVNGGASFGTPATLYGGDSTGGGDGITGNTLNMNAFEGSFAGIHNFQNYNFVLPASVTGGGTVLTITGPTPTDLAGTNIAITGIQGNGKLAPGARIVLLDNTTDAPASVSASDILQGISLLYDFDVSAQGGQLLAIVDSNGARVNPQLKSLSEGRLAGLAFVNQGADLIAGPGMYSALQATRRQGYGFAPFASMSGGSSRYDTGSHINVNGFSMMTGLAWRAPLEPQTGSFIAGAFFEAGRGNYDSHNSFSSVPSVKGDGDTSYYGGGVLSRYEVPAGPGGIYGEASFRAGHVSTDFSSNDIMGSGGNADYDSGSAYYGAHAGLGYVWNINDKAALDFSSKYIWTRRGGDSLTIQGDRIKFEAADSQRWRTGARFSYAVNDMFTPYVGAYYDHEFDGRAKAATSGLKIDAPDLKGGTGVGELGLTFKPSPASGFSFDLGVQGYTGVRRGVAGSAQLKYEF